MVFSPQIINGKKKLEYEKLLYQFFNVFSRLELTAKSRKCLPANNL